MRSSEFLNLLGIGAKAGKLAYGATACESAIKKKKAALVILSDELTENGKKSMLDQCKYYHVKAICDVEDLGRSVGKPNNKLVCVLDGNFANRLLQIVHGQESSGGVVSE